MEQLGNVPPPPNLGLCSTCKCWVVERRDLWAIAQIPGQVNQPILVRMLIDAGRAQGLEPEHTFLAAPCAWSRPWSPTGARDWCYQWVSAGMTEAERFALHPPVQALPTTDEIISASGMTQGNIDERHNVN